VVDCLRLRNRKRRLRRRRSDGDEGDDGVVKEVTISDVAVVVGASCRYKLQRSISCDFLSKEEKECSTTSNLESEKIAV